MKLDPSKVLSQFTELQQGLQDKLNSLEIEATAGGGMVKVSCNGYGDITKLSIDPEAVNKDDVELLEDLIRAAVNQARARAREQAQEELRKLFGGIPLPDMFGGLPV